MGVDTELKNIRAAVDRARGKEEELRKIVSEANSDLDRFRARHEAAIKAREVIIHVAKKTQKRLEVQLTDLVTLCIGTVFPDNSEFKIKFEQRRNTLEADLFIVEQGTQLNPMDSSGGGLMDMAAIGLRIALWSLSPGRPVFILDEPLKNLSPDKDEISSQLLKKLCDDLGIQIIMVSHSEGIVSYADKVFNIKDGNLVEE